MSVLRARLLEAERSARPRSVAMSAARRSAPGERSEKIRTYNFPNDRVTDHRIGLSVHNLPGCWRATWIDSWTRSWKPTRSAGSMISGTTAAPT